MNENNATAKKTRRNRSSSRRRGNRKSATGAADAGSKQPKQPKQTKPTADDNAPPSLYGVLTFIKPVVESHRPRLAKAMADHSKAMLMTIRDIRDRIKSIKKFNAPPTSDNASNTISGSVNAMVVDAAEGEDVNNDSASSASSGDAATAQPPIAGNARATAVSTTNTTRGAATTTNPTITETPTFVPISLRKEMPLKPSKMITNDSRVSDEYSKVLTALEAANRLHDSYLIEISKHAKTIAELELAARIKLLEAQYSEALDTISQGLVFVHIHLGGKHHEDIVESDIAAIAAAFTHEHFEDEHWASLPFIHANATKETYIELKKNNLTDGQRQIAEYLFANRTRPARLLVDAVCDELKTIIPALTTNLWTHDVTLDNTKALDAKLRAVTTKKAVDKANQRLNDALDKDAGELLQPVVEKEVNHAVNKALSRKKKSARKNSSAEDKTQSLRADSGRKNQRKSRDGKRSKRDTSSDSSGRSGKRRGQSRRRQSKNEDDGRKSTPVGILRLKTDKWDPRRHRGESSSEISEDDDDSAFTSNSSQSRKRGRDERQDRRRGHRDGASSAKRRSGRPRK